MPHSIDLPWLGPKVNVGGPLEPPNNVLLSAAGGANPRQGASLPQRGSFVSIPEYDKLGTTSLL